MTKVRPPISIDTALARIAGQVDGGWDAMALHVGYQPRTVRAWGDVDRDEQISLPSAIRLDVLFQAHGGVGAPLYEAHGDMVRIAAGEVFGDKHELRRHGLNFMRETNEANLAVLEAAEPDAGPVEQVIAIQQLLEARQETDILLVKLGRKPPEPGRGDARSDGLDQPNQSVTPIKTRSGKSASLSRATRFRDGFSVASCLRRKDLLHGA